MTAPQAQEPLPGGAGEAVATGPAAAIATDTVSGIADDSVDSVTATGTLKLGRRKHNRRTEEQDEEYRAGRHWGVVFKEKAALKDPDIFEKFLIDVKNRLMRRHPTISAAFNQLENSDYMTYQEFERMLRKIQIPMEAHVTRRIFTKCSGGATLLDVDQFKASLMQGTITKMGSVMKAINANQDRIKGNTNEFLRRLARSSEVNTIRTVDRFQQKVTIAFCKEFWATLLGYVSKTLVKSVIMEQPTFEKLIKKAFQNRFQGFMSYDMDFMLKIFNRIQEKSGRTAVSLNEILTVLLLICPENDRQAKVELWFEMFDTNYAGCLLYEQIHAMCQMICGLRPMAEDSYPVVSAADDTARAFGEELAAQEGLRVYEQIRWHLQRRVQVHDIVSVEELWAALESNQGLLETIIPGAMRIRWVADPLWEPPGDEEPAAEEAPERRRPSVAPARPASQSSRTRTPPSTAGMGPARRRNWASGRTALGASSAASLGCRVNFADNSPAMISSSPFRYQRTQDFRASLRKSTSRLEEMVSGFSKLPEPDEHEVNESSFTRSASAPLLIPLPPTAQHTLEAKESAARFRLFLASRAGVPKHRLKPIVVGNQGMSFRCQLCHEHHRLYVDCSRKSSA